MLVQLTGSPTQEAGTCWHMWVGAFVEAGANSHDAGSFTSTVAMGFLICRNTALHAGALHCCTADRPGCGREKSSGEGPCSTFEQEALLCIDLPAVDQVESCVPLLRTASAWFQQFFWEVLSALLKMSFSGLSQHMEEVFKECM